MRVWIACFLVLFAIAELYQWMKQFTLPLPVYILGGALLAIASNSNRRAGFPFGGFRDRPQPNAAINPPADSPLEHSPSTPLPPPPKTISLSIPRSDDRSK